MNRDGHTQSGFTLIELMITIALMAMLALLAAPFGRQWADSNRQMQGRSELLEGVARARAVALRNAFHLTGSTPDQPVETVRLELDTASRTLRVVQRTSAGWPAADAAPIWVGAPLDPGISLALHGHASTESPLDCVGYDTRGMLATSGPCAPGQDRLRVAIHSGDLEAILVELL